MAIEQNKLNFRSASAVALASGWARWEGAILHNMLMMRGAAYPKGLQHNGLLCNIAWGVVVRWVSALVF